MTVVHRQADEELGDLMDRVNAVLDGEVVCMVIHRGDHLTVSLPANMPPPRLGLIVDALRHADWDAVLASNTDQNN